MPHPLFGNVQPVSFQLLDKFWPGEVPIVGGSAKSTGLDRELLDRFLQSGGAHPRQINALEADWLASAVALYYVTPGLRTVLRWAWTDIRTVALVERRGMYATLRVDFREEAAPVLMKVGSSSASRLLAFQEGRTLTGSAAPATDGPAGMLKSSSRAAARVARRWGLSEEDLTEQRVEALVDYLRTLPEDNPMRLQAEEHYEVILPAHLVSCQTEALMFCVLIAEQ